MKDQYCKEGAVPMGNAPRAVIIITDGDAIAARAVQHIAGRIGGRCISRSSGNPTPLTGFEMVNYILQTPHDPVLVMFDDNGHVGMGDGERALRYVALHPLINVLGAVAVASNTEAVLGTEVDVSVDARGRTFYHGVDKDGNLLPVNEARIYGDTVDILSQLPIPFIVGMGDIGKMQGRDHTRYGCPVTRRAIELILERSGYKWQANNPQKK